MQNSPEHISQLLDKIYTPAEEQAGEGITPPPEAIETMTKFNEELAKAEVLMSLDGLHPLAEGSHWLPYF